MSRSALSVRSFRSHKTPRPPTNGTLIEGFVDSLSEQSDLLISRRQMLALTGTVAACAASATPAAAAVLSSATVEAGSGSATIRIGRRVLKIEARSFGGSPTLDVTGDEDAFAVLLRGATYPGTDIPADFTLRVSGARTRPWMRLETALGAVVEVPLLAWLEGRLPARAPVRLTGLSSRLGPAYRLTLDGEADAVVRHDLGLELSGSRIARVEGPGAAIVTDRAVLWIAEREAPTFLTRRVARRTFVQLARGGEPWSLPRITTRAGHAVDLGFAAFDLATLECAETSLGGRYAVLTVDDASGSGLAWAHPADGEKGTSPSPIPLALPRLAVDCGTESFALEAQMAEAVTWVHQRGKSLLIGRDDSAPNLSAVGTAGEATRVDFTTRILGVAAPFGDGDVAASPIMFPEDVVRSMAGLPSLKPFAADGVTMAAEIPDAASMTLTRRTDMLTLKFEFFNLQLIQDGGWFLFARMPDQPSYLVVEFPPQAVLDEAFYEEATWATSSSSASSLMSRIAAVVYRNPKTPPISARIADPTRLAFTIPYDQVASGIPYTLEGLLDWTLYDHSVVPGARSGAVTPVTPRRPYSGMHDPIPGVGYFPPETSIEAPWGLILSPHTTKQYWKHRVSTFSHNGVTELWHTTLKGRTIYLGSSAEAVDHRAAAPIMIQYKPEVRVVWARGYAGQAGAEFVSIPFRNSLTTPDTSSYDLGGQRNRFALVDLTTKFQHDPVDARRLTLTPLGAWLDLKGQWAIDDPPIINEPITTKVEAWEHRATMGRDQYVKVVKAGRLFPWGHRASLITITERKFRKSPSGYQTAYLIQRSFIFIRELEKTYPSDSTKRSHYNPFKKVTFKTHITPDLKNPDDTRAYYYNTNTTTKITAAGAFWPVVLITGKEVGFKYVAEDWDGSEIEFVSPLIWIDANYAHKVPPDTPLLPERVGIWREINICDRAMAERNISLNGQMIAFAKPLPAGTDRDRRVLETVSVKLRAENVAGVSDSEYLSWPNGTIHFHPQLHRAKVRLHDAEALMNVDSGVWTKFWEAYLNGGYLSPNNYGRVFLQASDDGKLATTPSLTPVQLNIPPDRSGGFASPNISIGGVSAYYGPFGGDPAYYGTGVAPPTGSVKAAALAPGEMDPTAFFAGADPVLFGGITLGDILKGVGIPLDKLPKFNDFTEVRGSDTWGIYEYFWETDKFGSQSDIFLPHGRDGLPAHLRLRTYLEKNLTRTDAAPTSGVEGRLDYFTLSLFKIIEVEFDWFGFGVVNGGEVQVDPKINDIRFAGALEFVNSLRELMNFTSKDGGFAIDIDGSGLSAIVTIALPDIAVGVFSLKNMAITAGFKLPFDGSPLRFPISFCTREKPFELAVSGFGGGGYFLVELQADPNNALASLELSFEFGISCSVSLCGIASGGVEIKGGVLLRIAGEQLSFKAYFRMGGYLDILGIISCSIVFNLSLEYQNKAAAGGDTSMMIGEASLTIEIEILFFSFSVDLTVHKEFEGDDPRFADYMNAGEWADYCEAYGLAKLGA